MALIYIIVFVFAIMIAPVAIQYISYTRSSKKKVKIPTPRDSLDKAIDDCDMPLFELVKLAEERGVRQHNASRPKQDFWADAITAEQKFIDAYEQQKNKPPMVLPQETNTRKIIKIPCLVDVLPNDCQACDWVPVANGRGDAGWARVRVCSEHKKEKK